MTGSVKTQFPDAATSTQMKILIDSFIRSSGVPVQLLQVENGPGNSCPMSAKLLRVSVQGAKHFENFLEVNLLSVVSENAFATSDSPDLQMNSGR